VISVKKPRSKSQGNEEGLKDKGYEGEERGSTRTVLGFNIGKGTEGTIAVTLPEGEGPMIAEKKMKKRESSRGVGLEDGSGPGKEVHQLE